MPLSLKIDCDEDIELAIWETTENPNYFMQKLEVHDTEITIIQELRNRKMIEWLSSRYLLHLMTGRSLRGKFTKDIHGKPHLENSSHHISISHSKDLVAVVASELLVGIDIQYFVSKIHRIKQKFTSDQEIGDITENKMLHALHVIWGAKESLYKAYGKRELDFKKNISISNLDLTSDEGRFSGRLSKDSYQKDFDLKFKLFEKFALVYAKERI